MRFTRFLSVAVIFTATLSAQPASERVDVVLIEVPVNVVDRAGNAVKGLAAENFEVLDDGKKRTITHFEAIDLNAPVSERERFSYSPAARRNFLLVFDLSYSSPGTVERAAEAARDFIRKGMSDRDLAGVITFTVERGFEWLTAFTSDRRSLDNAVRAIGSSTRLVPGDPLLLSVPEPSNVASGAGAAREQIFRENMEDMSRPSKKSSEELERLRIRKQIENFATLARVLDRLRGQKQVILLSEGFDASLLQGRSAGNRQQDDADLAAALSGEVWKIDNDQRFGNTATANVLDQMGTLFRRSDVVLHAFDIKGLRSDVDAREGRKPSSTESLHLMAESTGGQLFKNSNDVSENFTRMLRQQQTVYVLGFQVPAPGTPGKFHNLKVRVRDVPGARLFHRSGYYEPSAEASVLEKNLTAVEIIMNDIPQEAIGVDILAVPFRAEVGNPQVPVIVEVAGPTLLDGVTGNSLDAEIFVYAFDQDYAVRDFLHQKVGLDLSKLRQKLSARGLKFYGALNLPAGEYEVKALVRVAQTGQRGFERTRVQVPDFTTTTSVLPPFVVTGEDDWVMVKQPPRRAAEVDYPFTISSQPFVPAAMANMLGHGSYEVAVFGYNLEPEGMELAAVVRDAAGKEQPANITLLGRTPSGTDGPAKLLFSFKPNGLAAGRYALNFSLKPRNATQRHTVSVPFVIN